jgi:type III restriction enzyme
VTWLSHDQDLIGEIASRLDLRPPNRQALTAVIERIAADGFHEVVCELATGVGKTYIMAALVDYLTARGVRNILIVTPGKTIQDKTVANFTPGSRKYVPGMEAAPWLITADTFRSGRAGEALHEPEVLKLFVFNVQQLIEPSAKASRRVRKLDEYIGTDLYSHLRAARDLVVIADEHHVYRSQARQFSSAVRRLRPRALVGLTATPDPADEDKVVYRYTLGDAIADGLVKIPVIVYRKDGHKDTRTQLADACHLLRIKSAAYDLWMPPEGGDSVSPVLFVVCQTVRDAEDTAELLATEEMLGDPAAVLTITAQSPDEALAALAEVEEPGSPVRAVVSVDKLKEGWDAKNIGVIVALRTLASQTLTEQVLGRGLRLPYGRRTGVPMIDQVDIIAHDSYRRLLAEKESLLQRVIPAHRRTGGSGQATAPSREPADEEEEYQVTEHVSQGTLRIMIHPRPAEGDPADSTAALIIQDFEAIAEQGRPEAQIQVLQRVPGAPQIRFPRRERKVTPVQFSLSDVTNAEAKTAGADFASEITVPLMRVALNVRRTTAGSMTVESEAQPSETATQKWLPVSEVQDDLRRRVFSLGLVPKTVPELNAATRVIESFLAGAGVSADHEVSWSAERARQAVEGISVLIQRKYDAQRLQPEYEFRAIVLPAEPRPMPTDILDRYCQFERGQWYKGWRQSILPVAKFEAETTEFRLASIMDSTPAIEWWLRLRREDAAFIELDTGARYYPDFIAIDVDGVFWIVEGKSDRNAQDRDAQMKMAAAEDYVRYVNDYKRFGTWRYLFCTEAAIRNSRDSWDGLLAAAGSRQGR